MAMTLDWERDVTLPETPIAKRRLRYLVIDRDAPDGEIALPAGGRAKVVASFSTREAAAALTFADHGAGHRLSVLDSHWLAVDATKRRLDDR